MKKILNFISDNILFICVLFLLAFIPLYPKVPLLDVAHTWVYIRLEDFVIAAVLTLWIFLVLFKKVKLKTPLTPSIFLFWIIGAIATFHGVLIIFPTLSTVFSNVAFLSFLRRLEYLSLFFVAYSAMKEKRFLNYVIFVLVLTLVSIIIYGFGQKYLGFPAYLTMNEEFAKGVALTISSLGRVSSTFAGHYDLAAYLVLIIPILISLSFGFKNWLIKIILLLTSILGFALLFTTVSRVSLFVLLLSLLILLILQKKKLVTLALIIITGLFLILSPSLLQRYANTVSQVNVLVDAETGAALGEVKEMPREYFKDKLVLRQYATAQEAQSAKDLIVPFAAIPQHVQLLMQPNESTGESLPQGTSYINLSLSPIVKKTGEYYTEKSKEKVGGTLAEVRVFDGNYLVKRARAYDLSFTTRFQGEWPNTFDAFKENIFLGSGYGSVSLAVDNNYLRILGESGLLGLAAFMSIFLIAGIYIKRSFSKINSPVAKSFVLGFVVGTLGLMLNGILIDVFEASKIAFTYWILMGVTLGILHLYNPEEVNIYREIKKAITSSYAVILYLFIITVVLLFPFFGNYFVGDDFTWLKWGSSPDNLLSYFTEADGFFYRPGTRLYFALMHQLFWLNQTFYHFASIFLHFSVAVLLFLTLRKILKNHVLSIVGAFLFLALSGYHEAVFWISSTGTLFSAIFALSALLSFIYFRQKKNWIYLALSLVSISFGLLFQEMAVVIPLIIIAYDLVFGYTKLFKKIYLVILSPLLPYLILRFISSSHWFSGDYSYDLLRLPYNVVGNAVGYFMLELLGPQSLGFYSLLRNLLKENILFATIGAFVFIFVVIKVGRIIFKRLSGEEKKILIFGILFFVISLLPFLGLGNIASRYSYLSSIGFVIIFIIFIKKSIEYLKGLGDKYTTSMMLILISLVFFSLHLFQLQKIHDDWNRAGEISEKFLISFESIYKDYWIDRPMHFYFVDVPIKNGEAWVFPVGLNDALWFVLPNKEHLLSQAGSVEEAFSRITDPKNSNVFRFDADGRIHEYQKRTDGSIVPIE